MTKRAIHNFCFCVFTVVNISNKQARTFPVFLIVCLFRFSCRHCVSTTISVCLRKEDHIPSQSVADSSVLENPSISMLDLFIFPTIITKKYVLLINLLVGPLGPTKIVRVIKCKDLPRVKNSIRNKAETNIRLILSMILNYTLSE